MDLSRSFYGAISEIIRREMNFKLRYVGKVENNTDEKSLGRCLITVPYLGINMPDQGIWAYPSDKNSMLIPGVGDFVEVYFLNGDPNLPVYAGIINSLNNMIPSGFDGNPQTQVIFQSPDDVEKIIWDGVNSLLKIGAANEAFIKGTTAKSQLDKDEQALAQLQTDLTTWIPAPGDGGAALKAILTTGFLTKIMADYSNILSTKIKGE
jgi:hypothetical protein